MKHKLFIDVEIPQFPGWEFNRVGSPLHGEGYIMRVKTGLLLVGLTLIQHLTGLYTNPYHQLKPFILKNGILWRGCRKLN